MNGKDRVEGNSRDFLAEARAARLAGRPDEAEALCLRAIALEPENAAAHAELGLQRLLLGRHTESVDPLRRAAQLDPSFWLAYSWLAAALRPSAPAEALTAYDRAIALRPDEAALHSNRGNLLVDLGRPAEALAAFERATELSPDFATAWMNRGYACYQLAAYQAACEAFDRALALDPGLANAYLGRAGVHMALERWSDALADYDAALRLNPDDARSHLGRGRALVELDFLQPVSPSTNVAALASFDRAVELDPTLVEARWSRALTRLRVGRFADGWDDYEWRWDAPSFVSRSCGQVTPVLQARLARRVSPDDLVGRNVTVVTEQGVGDVLLFASILPEVLSRALAVSLVCEPRLHRLFAASFPELRLLTPDATVAETDLVLAIGSLAALFRRRAEDMPGVPYLRASDAVRTAWADRLGPREGVLRIGVSWRGGLQHTGASARSLSLTQLAPVLETPGCEFVSLQYGDVTQELVAWNAAHRQTVREPPGDVSDFEELAALVQNLDLVVSVQTAVVHLAGATGTPCLTMVPRRPEWRYGVHGDRLPWYGSVRLFRQAADGDWAPVIACVAQEVASRTAATRSAEE